MQPSSGSPFLPPCQEEGATKDALNYSPPQIMISKRLLHRWAENFSAFINRLADMSNAVALDSLPQANTELGRPPSEEEVKAIKQFSDGKAPGADSIPGEVYKHGGGELLQRVTNFKRVIS